MPSKLALTSLTVASAIGFNRYLSSHLGVRIGFWTGLVCILVLLPCWAICSRFLHRAYYSSFRDLPTPPGASWLTGHVYEIIMEPLWFGTTIRKWVNEVPNSGLLRVFDLFSSELLFVTGPAALADVLVHNCYDFMKPEEFRLGGLRSLGDGILLAEGDVHKKQRKTLMPAFTFRAVKNLYPMFWEKSKALVQAITAHHECGEEIEVEVNGWASKAALDIIGVSALDTEFNSLNNPNAELSNIYSRYFSPTFAGVVFDVISHLIPMWLTELIPNQRNRDLNRSRVIIQQDVHSRVSGLSQEQQTEKSKSDTDILSIVLDSGHFSEHEIVEQMMTFLVAGHETTATALTWVIYLLCQHPEIQTRLRDELAAASALPDLRGATSADQVTYTTIDSLPYLAAVVNEALRLYPPVGMTVRVAARDTHVIGHPVPQGTRLVLAPWAVNASTGLWGSNAAEFVPERWLAAGGKANPSGGADSNYSFLTFLHGPRSCIGQGFARAELLCMLAAWVRSFETSLKRGEQGEELQVKFDTSSGITVKPKGGLWVKLRVLK